MSNDNLVESNSSLVKILFLASDPSDASRLRIGQELRDIQERLKLSRHRDRFLLEQQLSARPRDISQAILDFEPQVVHFSGHGKSTGELCFEDNLGRIQPVNPDALAALFKLVSDQVHCVLLNACYSETQAKAIAKHIQYVIGMSQEIGDKAAIAFSVGFYKALVANRTIDKAYKFGCAEIQLEDNAEHLVPILHQKKAGLKTKWTLVLTATIHDLDMERIETILESLRQISGDPSMKIEGTEEGSVKLLLDSSEEAFKKIEFLFKTGQLTELSGFSIQDICTTVASQQTILFPSDQAAESIDSRNNVFQDSVLERFSLEPGDLQHLYSCLVSWARIESSSQLIERVRRLFIDAVEDSDSRVNQVLNKISNPRFPIEEFNDIFNRCCYILLNRWAMRSMEHAIQELLDLLESASPKPVQPEKQRQLQERVKLFTQTEQFQILKGLSQRMQILTLLSGREAIDQNRPLSDLIQRYPYLYENYFISQDIAYMQRQVAEIVRRIKAQKQKIFETDLAQYVMHQAHSSRNNQLVMEPIENPTLLDEQSLVFALKQFAGKVQNSSTERDLARGFLANSNQATSFKIFKGELYDYLTSAIDSEYGKHGFYRHLWAELNRIQPEHDSSKINDFLLDMIYRQLFNFLVVKNIQNPEHYVFVDLHSNVGATSAIRLLLRIALLWNRGKSYLEQRFSILFNHYLSCKQGTVQWLIECLENLHIALTTNFTQTNFSLVDQL